MAVINQWERRVLPQGGIARQEDRSGEVLGRSLQQLGQTGSGLAVDLAQIQQTTQRRNDAAWLGEQKPQAIIDLNKQINALNDPASKDTYVDPTSDDYETSIGKVVDDYTTEATKKAPSGEAQAELRNYITGLKANLLESGGKYADQSRYTKRIAQIDESNRKWGSVIVAQPGQFSSAVAEQEKLIRAQISDPLKADEQVRKMKSTMAGFAMNGEADKNPQAFLKNMTKWGEQGAEPGDIAQAQNIADARIKQQQAEAKAEAQRRKQQEQVSVASLTDDAISSVQANGGIMPLVDGKPLITEKRIRSAYADDPIRAQRAVDKLNRAQFIGQAKAKIAGQTSAEDAALSASLAPTDGGIFTDDDATVQNAVNAAIKAKQSALSDEIAQDIKDSQSDAAATWNKNAADWLQTTTVTGVVPEDARVAAAESGSAEARAFLGKMEQQARLTQAGMQINRQPNSVDQTMIDTLGLDIESTGPGSGARAAEAQATTQAIAEKQKAIAADPGGYFGATNPGLKSGWAAVDDSPSDQAVAENTVAMSVQAQLDYGLSPEQVQPFPSNRAVQYGQTIMTAPPDQALATIDYVRSISGESGLKQVLGQKGIPGMAKFLAFADLPAQEPVRAAALESMKIPPDELNKLVKDRGVKESDIDDQVTATIGPLLNTLPPGAVGPYHDALAQVAKLYVAKGRTPAQAAQLAWSAFDQAYAFHDTYRTPRAFDDTKVENGKNAVMQNLSKFPIVPQAGGPNMSGPLPDNPDLAAVVTKYPALAKVAGNVVIDDKPGDVAKQGYLESYPPWESYNPHPGKFTSEIFDASAKGDRRTELIAGDMLHYIGAVNPETGEAVDPKWRQMKSAVLSQLSPRAQAISMNGFKRSKEGHPDDTRTYAQWLDTSWGDEFIMGNLVHNLDEWKAMATPGQRKTLSEMNDYLTRSPESDYALNQTIKQLQTGGARWVTNADDTGLILTYDVDQNGLPGAAVKTANGRLEVLFSDLESGKYGFAVAPDRPGVKMRPGIGGQ